ncbi:hypothetical protein GCM10008956_30090 [Deinococcus arenae]|uniref:Uncharacterized protein n=1 Tax=Deinococcus arenae TaxID=1452751 RepID=A0A8H9L827_9DEIO|nr:hypothetical protein GCM10008956_30090 [Deinococcus arenae]
MTLQGGEVSAVRGVPGGGVAAVLPEALRQGVRHLLLQRLELPVRAGIEALAFSTLGARAHHGHPVRRSRGRRGHGGGRTARRSWQGSQGVHLPLQLGARGRQAGRLLPLQGSRAQDRGDGLTLSRDRAGCLPLQGAVMVRQLLSWALEVRLWGASCPGRLPLELVEALGHDGHASAQLTAR